MEIRVADLSDRTEIVGIYERSQVATGIPNLALVPPVELGQRLYARNAIERFVAVEAGRIVGHGLIEGPNPSHQEKWRRALGNDAHPVIEMGGAFVEPEFSGRGIWTALLLHRIAAIRKMGALPVTATWTGNEHVKRTFRTYGGTTAGLQSTAFGDVDLFVFQLQ